LINSLKLLLYNPGHIDIDDKDLVEEHLDHLSLILFKVRMNLSDLVVHLVLLPDKLIVVLFALHKTLYFRYSKLPYLPLSCNAR
jgi:hypothetical protein